MAKIKINGIEVEGTPEDLKQILFNPNPTTTPEPRILENPPIEQPNPQPDFKPEFNKKREGKKWNANEINYLRKHYDKTDILQLCNAMGRTRHAIRIAHSRYIENKPALFHPHETSQDQSQNTQQPISQIGWGWSKQALFYLRDNWLHRTRGFTNEECGIKNTRQMLSNHRQISKILGKSERACNQAYKLLEKRYGISQKTPAPLPKNEEAMQTEAMLERNQRNKERMNWITKRISQLKLLGMEYKSARSKAWTEWKQNHETTLKKNGMPRKTDKVRERMTWIQARIKTLTREGKSYEQAWTQASNEYSWKQKDTPKLPRTEPIPKYEEDGLVDPFNREEMLLLKSLTQGTISDISLYTYQSILTDRKESQFTTFCLEVIKNMQELNRAFNMRGLFKLDNGRIIYQKN